VKSTSLLIYNKAFNTKKRIAQVISEKTQKSFNTDVDEFASFIRLIFISYLSFSYSFLYDYVKVLFDFELEMQLNTLYLDVRY